MNNFVNQEKMLNEVYKKISDFVNERNSNNELNEIAIAGLRVFWEFVKPHGLCSLYLLNENTFEFEHLLTLPEKEQNEMKLIFEKLIDSNTIGSSLQSLKPSFIKNEENSNKDNYFICIPLLSIKGILGLIVLKTGYEYNSLNSDLLRSMNNFTGFFAASLECLIIYQNYRNTQDALDQIVAERTIRIEKSKTQLGEKLENLKRSLTNTLPHEVRTPINQIMGNTQILKTHFSSVNYEEAYDMLHDISVSAERLRRLFENYLYYANLNTISLDADEIDKFKNEITLSFEDTVMGKLMMKASEYNRKDNLNIEIFDSAVYIPELFLVKVIDEIIDNAFKFSDTGSIVNVKAFPDGDWFTIQIHNFGRYMSEDQIQQIDAYTQFQRMAFEQQGIGLGLTIVTKIIAIIKAEFSIYSSELDGTTISVRLRKAENIDLEEQL